MLNTLAVGAALPDTLFACDERLLYPQSATRDPSLKRVYLGIRSFSSAGSSMSWTQR
jgi:hypothetical protein